MPTLSTFGGASVRSYGRNIQQTPAIVPKNAVLFLQAPSSTVPTGWSYYANGVGAFIRGASSNSEIGTTVTATGNVNVTHTTLYDGSHGTSSGATMFVEYTMSSIYGYTVALAQATAGSHQHSYTIAAQRTADTSAPPHYKFPVVTTSATRTVLPPYTIVFRKTAPSSQNYVKPVYYTDTVADKAWFRGHNANTSSYVASLSTETGISTSSGLHDHRGTTAGRPPSGGTASTWGYTTYAGAHTHDITLNWRVLLKGKMLNGWVSPFEEPVEYGMIILYTGQPKDLPAGWRVCDGTLGTPDMRGYYLACWYNQVSGAHDLVVTPNTVGEVTSVAVSNNAFTHTHYAGNARGDSGYNALHTNFSVTHNHTNSSGGTVTLTTGFDPGTCNLAFIQYKGI